MTETSLQPKLRRLNRDMIVLGARGVVIALTANIVTRGALIWSGARLALQR